MFNIISFFFWGKFIIITSVLIISAERVFRIKFLDQLESYRVYFSDETLMNISDFFYNNNFNFIMFKYISISISLGFIVIIQITYLIRELILIRYLLLKASNCREKEDYVHLVLILFINIGFVLFSLVTSFIMVTTFFLIIKRHVGV
jgi:hypothetical protein